MANRTVSRRTFLGGMAGIIGLTAASRLSAAPSPSFETSPAAPESVIPAFAPEVVPAPTETPTQVPAPVPTKSPPRVEAPKVIAREAWGARKATGPYRAHKPSRITVHHTAVVWKGGDTAMHLQGIQEFHMGPERKWVDIAYHYLIDRDGTAYAGRPETAAPDTATAGYDTSGHLALCVLGDFDTQQPSEQQKASLVRLVAWWMQTYLLPASVVAGHRDFAATTCPGKNLYAMVRDGTIVAEANRLLSE